MIRPARTQDAAEIAGFYVDIRRDTVPLIHSVEEVTAYLSEHILPRGTSYVWDENGQILAWLDIYEGWVEYLYCRRGATGEGFGKQLLNLAKSKSPENLRLYTFQVNNAARRFYAREGFQEIAYGEDNEERQPDVLLEWRPR